MPVALPTFIHSDLLRVAPPPVLFSHQQVWPGAAAAALVSALLPGVNISAGEINWTGPAGIWHFSDISILPLLFFVHAPTGKQYDGFTQKLRSPPTPPLHFLSQTMDDWEARNLSRGAGCRTQDLRSSGPSWLTCALLANIWVGQTLSTCCTGRGTTSVPLRLVRVPKPFSIAADFLLPGELSKLEFAKHFRTNQRVKISLSPSCS